MDSTRGDKRTRIVRVIAVKVVSCALMAFTIGACGGQSDDSAATQAQTSISPSSTTPMPTSASTTSPPAMTTTNPPVVPPEFAITSRVDGLDVVVDATIALPDGAVVFAGLTRAIQTGSDPDPGFFDVDFTEVVVQSGRLSVTLTDDPVKVKEFNDAFNVGEPETNLAVALDQVQVTLSFSPRNDPQAPAAVEAAGGRSGSSLNGSPQADVIGSLTNDPYTTLSVQQTLDLPYQLG